MRTRFGVILASALLAPVGAPAGAGIRVEQVQFQKGETGASLKGKIQGDETVDYTLRATAGQSMVVVFKPSNLSAYFNVLPPGSAQALFVGSSSGNRFEGALPADGTYTIRVYLMRSAARRNESSSYTLEVGVSGTPRKEAAPAPGTPPARFDASGNVKCSAGGAALDRWCAFRVVRDLPRRAADVWIANPTAKEGASWRFLHYQDEAFTTDDGGKLAWKRQDDDWRVIVDGRELYLLPDALIHGG
jgi:hypothetical protein